LQFRRSADVAHERLVVMREQRTSDSELIRLSRQTLSESRQALKDANALDLDPAYRVGFLK
jgi:hypothetical protein